MASRWSQRRSRATSRRSPGHSWIQYLLSLSKSARVLGMGKHFELLLKSRDSEGHSGENMRMTASGIWGRAVSLMTFKNLRLALTGKFNSLKNLRVLNRWIAVLVALSVAFG